MSEGSISGLLIVGLLAVVVVLFCTLAANTRDLTHVARAAIGGIARTVTSMIFAAALLLLLLLAVTNR
jgi:L-aminopeptidase/D-esterase-like protein